MYEIHHLNLITSSFCDLKCSYCFLHKNKAFRKKDSYIVEMWENGEYVNNLKKFFNKVNSDPLKVRDLSLWGGEPLIHLKMLSKNFKELMRFIPDLNSMAIPTNWCHIDIESLCELLQIINDNITPRKKEDLLHFHLQASIDGIEGDIFMKDGHFGSWDKYMENFNRLYEKLETMNLPNLSVDFCISATGTKENFLNSFSNNHENITKHIAFWDNFVRYVQNKVIKMNNPEMLLNTNLNFPTIALPVETSSFEGMEILKTVKTINQLFYFNNAFYKTNDRFMKEFFHCEADWPLCAGNHECPEADQKAVTIFPDGTITQCPDGFIENFSEYQNEFLEEKNYKEYKNTLLASQFFFNPLTASEKEIKDHEWYIIKGGTKDTYFPYINLLFNFAQELALSHQIDEIYLKNSELLLKHLTAINTLSECFRNSLRVTGLCYISGEDYIRRQLNGYVQEAYNFHLEDIKNTMEICVQNKIKEYYKLNDNN